MNEHEMIKTVTIPIKIVDGKVEYFYDDNVKLRDLENLRYGELSVPKSYFGNEDTIKKLMREEVVDFLPKGTSLYAQVRRNDFNELPNEIKELTYSFKDEKNCFIEGKLIEIILEEDLKLLLRGSKRARLESCKCNIPILHKSQKQVVSINQAYTLISEKVEPSRRSHGGNVFDKIYYMRSDSKYSKIDVLRNALEAKYEDENFIIKKENIS